MHPPRQTHPKPHKEMSSGKRYFIYTLVILSVMFASCRSRVPIAYYSTAQRDQAQQILTDYTASIHAGDQLHISIQSVDAEATAPFNQETNKAVTIGKEVINPIRYAYKDSLGLSTLNTYLVDKQGNIHFPFLGSIKVEGMTPEALNSYIARRLRSEGYLKEVAVDTRIMNFRVTVLGEVANPDLFHVMGERLTILEALALAGDMTIYGQRTNVKVIRTVNGAQQIGELNLTDYNFLDSPYYYLQPNDIVYVEQNDIKKKSATYDPNTYTKVNIVAQSVQVLTAGVGRIAIATNR